MFYSKRRCTPTALLACLALLGAAVAFSACASKGQFTPFTEGSELKESAPEDASLLIGVDPANELFHQPRYDVTIGFKEGPHRAIKLGFIMDGEFRFNTKNKDTVQVLTSVKDGLVVKTDDVLLQALIDHVIIAMKYSPEISYSKIGRRITRQYRLDLYLLDDAERVLGKYSDTLEDSSDFDTMGDGSLLGQRKNPEPMSPAGIFQWMASRAQQ
ncbi:MAG: hypothetical protein HY075_06375 [Deltaproteobacteria bacterium]|nr:hypothetical protein [Deltaproteobacteria bacterium]